MLQIFGPTADPLANSTDDCVASIDDRTFFAPTLQVGVRYQVLLTSFDPGGTGSFSYSYQGPGALTVDLTPEVPIEDEVCDADDPVPAGYTLLNGTTRNDDLAGGTGNDIGIDTPGSNRFTSIESRELGSTPPPVNTN